MVYQWYFTSNAFVSLFNRRLNNNQLTSLTSGIFSNNTLLQTLWVIRNNLLWFICAILYLLLLFHLKRFLYNNQLTTLPSDIFSNNTLLQTLWVIRNDLLWFVCAISHLMLCFTLQGTFMTINWQHYHRVCLTLTRHWIICEW